MIFRITPLTKPAGLDAELERLSYPHFDTTAVKTAAIDPVRLGAGVAEALPLADWVQAVGTLRDSPAVFQQAHLARLQGTLLPQRALVVRHQGHVVAAGLTIVENGWAGLFDIVTASAARGQGFGRRTVELLLRAAWELGARQAYLQFSADNTPARQLYAHYGFTERYRYWYRGHPE